MDLHYWEKQLILYTKGHFGRTDYKKDIKHFPANMYGLSLKYTDDYNVLGMVTRLYQKLIDADHIQFKLERFISDIFRRASIERHKDEVVYDDVLRQMLAEFQGLAVLDDNGNRIIELGTADVGLMELIKEEMETVK